MIESNLEGNEVNNANIILFFDGDCAFCLACASFVKKHDKKQLITLRKLQESKYEKKDGCYESILFIKDGEQSQFSSAVIGVLKTMGGFWWLVGTIIWIIPKPVRDWGYHFVGKRRHWFIKKIH